MNSADSFGFEDFDQNTVERSRACGVASDALNVVTDPDGTGSCAGLDALVAMLNLTGVFYSTVANTLNSRRNFATNHLYQCVEGSYEGAIESHQAVNIFVLR